MGRTYWNVNSIGETMKKVVNKLLVVLCLMIAGAALWVTFRPHVVKAVHSFANKINK
jgi:hypothetical protein